jgi:hypothetical protein
MLHGLFVCQIMVIHDIFFSVDIYVGVFLAGTKLEKNVTGAIYIFCRFHWGHSVKISINHYYLVKDLPLLIGFS